MPVQEYTLDEIQDFKGRYPRQLWYLFFSEMWERFCFYGMRGMLILFMVEQLVMAEDTANLQYGATQAFVYAFTFIGGLFADKILGFRKSLFWGGLLMITGSCILAANPKDFFFLGLGFTIIGTGFFKPNISTMVGTLYRDGDPRRDAGFSLFYAGINVGALLGGYACIWMARHYSWNVAFGLAAIVMVISLVTFLFTQRTLGPIGLSPLHAVDGKKRKWFEIMVYIGSLLTVPLIMKMVAKTQYTDWFMYTIGPCTLIYIFYEMTRFGKVERKKLAAALAFIIFSILFWAFFEQSGGSLSLFAAYHLDNNILGVPFDPNGVNNASNSLFVILFSPLLGLAWVAMNRKKIEPNSVIKFGIGFIFLGLAFFTFYSTRFFSNTEGMTSLEVFTLSYLIITIGELCLSPIGLSVMTKLSPPRLQGVMMGMWFLASAYGQYVAGILGAGIARAGENDSGMAKLLVYTDGYKQLGIYALVCGGVMIALSPMIKKMMGGVK
jgi:POT family proton-dependent oligopeptide transporter